MANTNDTRVIDPTVRPTKRDGTELGESLGEYLINALDNAVEMAHGPKGAAMKPTTPKDLRKRTELGDDIAAALEAGEKLTMPKDSFALIEKCVCFMWAAPTASRILAAMKDSS